MLGFNGNLKVWVATAPCDMRKSFDGLSALAREKLRSDPMSGAAFVFTNKKRTLVKILYWDGSGLWVVAKRLEKGTFSWPTDAAGGRTKIALTPTALAMLTDGIQLREGCKRPWYDPRE